MFLGVLRDPLHREAGRTRHVGGIEAGGVDSLMDSSVATPELVHRKLTWEIIGSAMEVHRTLGPGLLESAYTACLAHELKLRGVPFIQEMAVPLRYKGMDVQHAFRLDFLVADSVVVEAKAVEALTPAHVAQVLTYLRMTGQRVGLIFNFSAYNLRQGMRRLIL